MSKILIIEDDQAYRKVYSHKFEISGHQTQTAVDGEEGLAKMKEFLPDIVLCDLMMPKMDGFQVLEHLNADAKLKATPVIILTNLSTADDANKVLKMGAKAIMVKSDNDPDTILGKVNEILGGKAPAEAPKPEAEGA